MGSAAEVLAHQLRLPIEGYGRGRISFIQRRTHIRDRAAADEARRFLDVALDNLSVGTVLTWGLTDRYLDPPLSWRLRLSGWRGRRLPYDAQLRPKPLHAALAQAFRAARPRPIR